MNVNTVRKFCNTLEKVATEYIFFDTPGNIFRIDESGIQVNNEPGALIKRRGLKMFLF